MERFATNKNGNIDSGTEVLANNIVFMQQAKELAISNMFGDLFSEGILNINMGTTNSPVEPFALKEGDIAGAFSVGIGVAYKQDTTAEPMIYERIAITDATEEYDSTKAQQTTFDGVDQYVATPKSSGCKNIPIDSVDTTYYVDVRYLRVCDNNNSGDGLNLKNYSIAKNEAIGSSDEVKRFYKWIDGYNIVLITNLSQQQGVIIGTVRKDSSNNLTFSDLGRTRNILVSSNVFMDYFEEGSGLTITKDGNKTRLSVNVDNITTQIENNKVRVPKDALYPYTKFCVNSGYVDNNYEPNILLTDAVGISVNFGVSTQIPLVVSPAYNDRYTVLPTDTLDNISSVRDLINQEYLETEGIYTICINNTDKDNNNETLANPKLELMKEIYIRQEPPSSTQKGIIWLNISTKPFKAMWFNGSVWVEYHGVPLGETVVNSSAITVSCYKFNSVIENNCKIKDLYLYNYSDNAEKQKAHIYLDDTDYIRIVDTIGLSFENNGAMYVYSGALNFGFNDVQINGNPIPRLPDYSTKTQVASSSNNDVNSWTATADGWIYAKIGYFMGSSDDTVFSINGYAIIDQASSTISGVTLGMYPIKKGDSIRVRRGITAYFYSYR